jgi:endonuclease YncB( thermonuclease family)
MRLVFLLLAVVAAFSSAALGQAQLAGKVLEVVDGRTIVFETSAGRMTARLQFIETPEVEQPLHETVRDHLSKLSLGKQLVFSPSRIVDRIAIGRGSIDGVDLSAQLIRDGAAWHEPPTSSGQPQSEAAEYAKHQELAKAEKRGVWSVAGVKTPWDIRAERRAALDKADRERRSTQPSKVGVTLFQTENRAGPDSKYVGSSLSDDRQLSVSAGIFTGGSAETYGLHTIAAPDGRYTLVYSSPSFVELANAKPQFKAEYRIAYYIGRDPHRFGSEWYALYVRSTADSYKFEKRRSSLVIVADGRSLPVGSPYVGATLDHGFGGNEVFFYKLSRGQVSAVAKAAKVHFKIDGLTGAISPEAIILFKQLADSMK